MKTVIQLQQQNLKELGSLMSVPNYNRTNNKIGIVHISVGGFHRALLALYLHQHKQMGEASDWGICGVGLREADSKLHKIFKKQDQLCTLMIKHPDSKRAPQVKNLIFQNLNSLLIVRHKKNV